MARRKRALCANIGSVSRGTTRECDLIPEFLWELKQQSPLHREHRRLVGDIESRMEADDYYESDDAVYDLEALFDALGAYAPDFMYFGAHPGDGSDYGFWLDESWEEQLAESGGIKVNDLADIPPDHFGYVAVVSDHGNVTMYRRAGNHRLIHLWSVV